MSVVTGTVITENFALTPLPTGNISGQITESGTGTPLTATIAVENTPVTATAHGNFSLALPAGSYTLTVTAWGHRVAHAAAVPVSVGTTTTRNFSLSPAPTILLVDSGAWYNAGEIAFYQRALDALDLPYHTRRIADIAADVPVSTTLAAYSAVLWSAPFDSPGFVSAGDALTDYLTGGGNLLLSGQDVAFFDGGGSAFFYAPYLHDMLKADFLRETDPQTVTATADNIFSGLTFAISGGDGANNQQTPDVLALPDPDFAAPALVYPDGGNAGQTVGHCLPYRAVVLPFGVEGIATATDRAAVISRTLAYFQSPRQAVGLEVLPRTETRVGNFGEIVTHTVRLFNTAETGLTDTLTLLLGSHQWETHLLSDTVSLAPCQTAWVSFTVTVPADAVRDASDTVALTVQSGRFPTLTTQITRTTKSPAPLLLVDDDRWYDFEGAFTQSLTAAGYQFDVWHVQGQHGEAQGTPPLAILQHYPQIVWFTGYDWFDPLTQAEEETLQKYLDGGGRLAFSGQEYLWNLPDHQPDDFARNYFGVDSHSDYLTSTMVSAVTGNPIGDGLGRYPLDFPPGYQNWTDSITLTAHADASFMGSRGYPIAATNFGTVTGTWHTAFFAFGPELIAEPDRTDLLRHTVGWLSWL
ncbi:MAG TPA: carboxypeptidase regulatory-like domain-containing protein, partial [Anaerolineae bacterium]|nr:carboxypeptidase regulatory-like domain-containing protein [Anaerolineae bacterium]